MEPWQLRPLHRRRDAGVGDFERLLGAEVGLELGCHCIGARVGGGDVQADVLGQAEPLLADLAGHTQLGRLLEGLGGVEEPGGDVLERDDLEVRDAVPRDHLVRRLGRPKHKVGQRHEVLLGRVLAELLARFMRRGAASHSRREDGGFRRPDRRRRARPGRLHAVGTQLCDRRAATRRVALVHEDQRLAVLHGGGELLAAVAREEVAARQEDQHRLRRLDVSRQVADLLEVVDVEEDADAGQQQLQLPLDDGHLVLPRRPDVREEEVPRHVAAERELRQLARVAQPDRAQLAAPERLPRRDGHEEQHDHAHEDDHPDRRLRRRVEAEQLGGGLVATLGGDGVEELHDHRRQQHAQQRELRADGREEVEVAPLERAGEQQAHQVDQREQHARQQPHELLLERHELHEAHDGEALQHEERLPPVALGPVLGVQEFERAREARRAVLHERRVVGDEHRGEAERQQDGPDRDEHEADVAHLVVRRRGALDREVVGEVRACVGLVARVEGDACVRVEERRRHRHAEREGEEQQPRQHLQHRALQHSAYRRAAAVAVGFGQNVGDVRVRAEAERRRLLEALQARGARGRRAAAAWAAAHPLEHVLADAQHEQPRHQPERRDAAQQHAPHVRAGHALGRAAEGGPVEPDPAERREEVVDLVGQRDDVHLWHRRHALVEGDQQLELGRQRECRDGVGGAVRAHVHRAHQPAAVARGPRPGLVGEGSERAEAEDDHRGQAELRVARERAVAAPAQRRVKVAAARRAVALHRRDVLRRADAAERPAVAGRAVPLAVVAALGATDADAVLVDAVLVHRALELAVAAGQVVAAAAAVDGARGGREAPAAAQQRHVGERRVRGARGAVEAREAREVVGRVGGERRVVVTQAHRARGRAGGTILGRDALGAELEVAEARQRSRSPGRARCRRDALRLAVVAGRAVEALAGQREALSRAIRARQTRNRAGGAFGAVVALGTNLAHLAALLVLVVPRLTALRVRGLCRAEVPQRARVRHGLAVAATVVSGRTRRTLLWAAQPRLGAERAAGTIHRHRSQVCTEHRAVFPRGAVRTRRLPGRVRERARGA